MWEAIEVTNGYDSSTILLYVVPAKVYSLYSAQSVHVKVFSADPPQVLVQELNKFSYCFLPLLQLMVQQQLQQSTLKWTC